MSRYWSKFWCSKGEGWFTLSKNFRGKGGSSTNDSWRQKTRVPGLSRATRGVVCVILRSAVLIQYRRVIDTQTSDHGYYPHRASATRVKMNCYRCRDICKQFCFKAGLLAEIMNNSAANRWTGLMSPVSLVVYYYCISLLYHRILCISKHAQINDTT